MSSLSPSLIDLQTVVSTVKQFNTQSLLLLKGRVKEKWENNKQRNKQAKSK